MAGEKQTMENSLESILSLYNIAKVPEAKRCFVDDLIIYSDPEQCDTAEHNNTRHHESQDGISLGDPILY